MSNRIYPTICGIYMITNCKNGMIYIGQTRDFYRRIANYKLQSSDKYERQYGMYRIVKEEGFDNFRFKLLEKCLPEELNEKEIYYIEKYDATNPNIGYNRQGGGGVYKMKIETRNRMSFSHFGLKETGITKRKKSKKVAAYNPETGSLIIAESGKLLGDKLGYGKDIISHAINTPYKVKGYYIYRYDYEERQKMLNKLLTKRRSVTSEYLDGYNRLNGSVETSDSIDDYIRYDDEA